MMQLQTANNHKILHWTCEICACMRAQLKPTENYWVYIPGLTLSQPQSQPQSLHPCNRDSTKSYTFKPLSPLATKQGEKAQRAGAGSNSKTESSIDRLAGEDTRGSGHH